MAMLINEIVQVMETSYLICIELTAKIISKLHKLANEFEIYDK